MSSEKLRDSLTASNISVGSAIFAFLSFGYSYKLAAFISPLTWLLGFFILYKVFPRIENSEKRTLHGFLANRYDSRFIGYFASLLSIIGFLGTYGIEILVGIKIANVLFPNVSSIYIILGLSLVVCTYTALGGFKSTIVKNLTKSWEESKRKEYQVISFQVDRGSEIAALTTILKEVKGAFEQIRADLSITLTDKSEEALDRLFPVLLSEGATRNYGLKELSMEEKISGIVVTIHTSEGKEVMKDYTLTELKQKVTAARAKQADPESLVIGLKIEKGCKMGYVTDTKQVLRECSALKINYSTDN